MKYLREWLEICCLKSKKSLFSKWWRLFTCFPVTAKQWKSRISFKTIPQGNLRKTFGFFARQYSLSPVFMYKNELFKVYSILMRSSRSKVFFKTGVLKRPATLLKTPTQVFSCEIFEIFKNTFFYRTPPVAASDEKYRALKNLKLLWKL